MEQTRIEVPDNVEIPDGYWSHFQLILDWAETRPVAEFLSLQKSIEGISNIARNCGGRPATVHSDFAPHSFGWDAGGMVGGCIYHAPNGDCSGGAPTYSVCLTAVEGWTLHT